jgi:hypothetical protein
MLPFEPVILAVDPGQAGERHEPRICAMLWSGDEDTRLLVSESFRGIQEFKAWLVMQRARWLGLAIQVHWTPNLIASKPLVEAITGVLVGESPPSADALTGEASRLRSFERQS